MAVSLQSEGTLQGMLVTGPHLRKGELLRSKERREGGQDEHNDERIRLVETTHSLNPVIKITIS